MADYNTLCLVVRAGKRKPVGVPFSEIEVGDTFFFRGDPIKVGRVKTLGKPPYVRDLLLETEDGNAMYGVDEVDRFQATSSELAS